MATTIRKGMNDKFCDPGEKNVEVGVEEKMEKNSRDGISVRWEGTDYWPRRGPNNDADALCFPE